MREFWSFRFFSGFLYSLQLSEEKVVPEELEDKNNFNEL